jgi:hypothetical protein
MPGTSARRNPTVLRAVLLAVTFLAGACAPERYVAEDRTDRRPRELQVAAHAGGTHHRMEIDGQRWYQTFSNALLVIDMTNGRELGRVEPEPFGTGGALVDLALDGDKVTVVADQTGVFEIDVSESASPKVVRTWTAAQLGMEPRVLSRVGSELWACGVGGCVRLADGKRYLTGEAVLSACQSPSGVVATVGRRVVAVEDGHYLGAASTLSPLPPGVGPKDGMLFTLQGANGATVGFMNAAFAEVASVAVPAFVRHARVLGNHLVVMTDRLVHTWKIADGRFTEGEEIPLKGGRDAGILRPNNFAVAGSFGRSMYRYKAEDKLPADDFYNVQREPGLLEVAVCDGRRILAGGREGFWMWKIGGDAVPSDKTTDITVVPAREVAAAWGSARVVPEKERIKGSKNDWGVSVEVKHDGTSMTYTPDGRPRIWSLELVDGDVWIGHDNGIDVLRRTETAAKVDEKTGKTLVGETKVEAINRFRFEGPALFIFPERLGGGASVVLLHGGFVQIKPMPVGPAPEFNGRGVVQ